MTTTTHLHISNTIVMKKTFILVLGILFGFNTFAQRVRVYGHYSLSYGFGDKTNLPSFGYDQSLAMGKNYSYRFHAGFKLYKNYALKPSLNSYVSDDKSVLLINKTFSNTTLNFPVGFEIKANKLSVGINTDVLGLTFAKKTSQASISDQTHESLQVNAASNNFLFAFKNRGNLNTELYFAFSPQEEFSIRVGTIYSRSQYQTSFTENTATVNSAKYGRQTLIPFIGLVFNFEK